MTNLLKAIINIIENPIYNLKDYTKSHNRVNNMGEALEEYIKDVFAGTIGEDNYEIRKKKIKKCFSYFGNQNNPPDCIIANGDAIEIKKTENLSSDLALNSSYPKAKLYINSQMINKECKECESWTEKDIIYAHGVCKDKKLTLLSFVYGIDYAAKAETYEKIKNKISTEINNNRCLELYETKELGRVNKVDPLGIIYLQIRGMWGIQNPIKTFEYVYTPIPDKTFNLMAIINQEKYNSFPKKDIEKIIKIKRKSFILNISDIEIKNPDNPAKYKNAKLIKFAI
jgi:hypothetical protein